MKKTGFWTSVADLVCMFPLTQPLRTVLLEMLCVGTQPSQVSNLPEQGNFSPVTSLITGFSSINVEP